MTCSVSRVLDGGSIQRSSRRLVCAAKSAKQVLQPQKRVDARAESYQFAHEEGKWRKNIRVASWIRGRRETSTQPVSTVKTDMKGRTNRRDHAAVKQLRRVWHFKCRPPFTTERLDYKALRSGGNNNYLSKSMWKEVISILLDLKNTNQKLSIPLQDTVLLSSLMLAGHPASQDTDHR